MALDALLGLILLAAYVAGMVAFAAGVTFVAIRVFPTKDRPSKKSDGPPSSDDGASNAGTESAAGRLFRKAKRAASG